MRSLSMFALLLSFAFVAPAQAQSVPGFCQKYAHKPQYLRTLSVLAKRMQYTETQLCTLPRLADIYITDTVLLNREQQPVPHIWITLHYSENSCQYYFRANDGFLTKSNCYNTW
ncbi:MAG: hypothetical protein KF802_14540 [Bdellovibrionaceae bacterium]|nr:hypothetical protein [Pseudobdellovibrionaceae bacterium]